MSKVKEIHLWWLWDTVTKDGHTPASQLKEVAEGMSICGKKVSHEELTVHLDDMTCVQCKIKATQQAA